MTITQFISEFFSIFISSSLNTPMDYGIAVAVIVGTYVYVYYLRPQRVIPPNPFDEVTLLRQIYDSQDARFATMALAINLVYVVLRVLYEMGLA